MKEKSLIAIKRFQKKISFRFKIYFETPSSSFVFSTLQLILCQHFRLGIDK